MVVKKKMEKQHNSGWGRKKNERGRVKKTTAALLLMVAAKESMGFGSQNEWGLWCCLAGNNGTGKNKENDGLWLIVLSSKKNVHVFLCVVC